MVSTSIGARERLLGRDGRLSVRNDSVLDYGGRERTRLRQRLEKNKLQTGYTNFTADLEHGDIPHREIQILSVHELARLASDLGGSLVRVFTGYENPAKGFNAQWNLVVESLRECARRAAEFRVVIGIQNHHDIAASSESLHQVIRAVNEPNCRAMFDAWAPALHGDDLFEAARIMGGITVHSTVANINASAVSATTLRLRITFHRYRNCRLFAIDDGFIYYRAFFQALCEGGFEGSVAYEICSPIGMEAAKTLLTAMPGCSSNRRIHGNFTKRENSRSLTKMRVAKLALAAVAVAGATCIWCIWRPTHRGRSGCGV
jgi:sugar phosphate isomerase/epimerase